MKSPAHYDISIIRAVRRAGRSATYVIRNLLSDFGNGPDLKTSQVLRRLKSLEKAGYVHRIETSYLVMITWELTDTGRKYVEGLPK